MTENQRRRVDCFERIDNFAKLYPEDFPAGRKVTMLLATVRASLAGATAGGMGQASHGGSARSGSATKADYYDELLEDLKAISRTARSMAEEIPGGLEQRFRMPRPPTYANVLTSARAFLADATPMEAAFLDHEMETSFLTDLAADIQAFEEAEDDQDGGVLQRVGSTGAIAQAVKAGTKAVLTMDPLMRNKYRNQSDRMATWLTARHVERAPRRAASPMPEN